MINSPNRNQSRPLDMQMAWISYLVLHYIPHPNAIKATFLFLLSYAQPQRHVDHEAKKTGVR